MESEHHKKLNLLGLYNEEYGELIHFTNEFIWLENHSLLLYKSVIICT